MIKKYFYNFLLCYSKYLAYKNWYLIQNLHISKFLDKQDLDKIKAQFNSKRKIFNFSHLNYLSF